MLAEAPSRQAQRGRFYDNFVDAILPQDQATIRVLYQDSMKLAERLSRFVAQDQPGITAQQQAALICLQLLAQQPFTADKVSIPDELSVETLQEQLITKWRHQLPQLDRQVHLAATNQTVEQVLQSLAQQGGVPIELLDGSLQDVAELTQLPILPIAYLPPQKLSLAEALDVVLHSQDLRWWVTPRGTIAAGSQRRQPLTTAWVYDVAHLIAPLQDELQEAADRDAQQRLWKDAHQLFLKEARQLLPVDQQATVAWYATGQLLVYGDPRLHTETTRLIQRLADPNARFNGSAAKLARKTVSRATARAEHREKSRQAQVRTYLLALHQHHAWRLLADAAAGHVDPEALYQLQVAWEHPHTPQLLQEQATALPAVRSLWALAEASRSLPEHSALQNVARIARRAAADPLQQLVQREAGQAPSREAAQVVLFAALADPENRRLQRIAKRALAQAVKAAEKGDHTLEAGRVLLSGGDSTAALQKLLEQDLRGPDAVVLAALACRREGDSAWEQFRTNRDQLLGNQPLPGAVVLLVNRLAVPQLKVASATPE